MIVNTINSNSAKNKNKRQIKENTKTNKPNKEQNTKHKEHRKQGGMVANRTQNFKNELQPLLLIKSIAAQQTNKKTETRAQKNTFNMSYSHYC